MIPIETFAAECLIGQEWDLGRELLIMIDIAALSEGPAYLFLKP